MPIFFGAISLPQMRKSGISTLRSMAIFFFFPLFFPKVVNSITGSLKTTVSLQSLQNLVIEI